MKIATAITKFRPPFIIYPTPGMMRMSFMIYVNKYKTIQFTTKLSKPKKRKKSGRESILSTGRTVTLIIHKIIPQTIYVLSAHREV